MAYMISTKDNPFNPLRGDDFKDWYMYDILNGYYSSEKLSRVAVTSPALSDEENKIIIEEAIDSIIENDFTNTYIKIDEDYIPGSEKGTPTP